MEWASVAQQVREKKTDAETKRNERKEERTRRVCKSISTAYFTTRYTPTIKHSIEPDHTNIHLAT
jgi:hypothetical protein